MMMRDTVASRILKHGFCAATMAALLFLAITMGGRVLQTTVATFASHTQSVNAIAFND